MNKYIFRLILLLLGGSKIVFAADVMVQVNGNILAQSCNVKSSDAIQNVIFDDLNASNFPTVGTTSQEKRVTIGLENCSGAIKNLSYQFSGEADSLDSSLLKIKGNGSSTSNVLATGLAIEILDANKNSIPLNVLQSANQSITATSYDFIFYLRYKSVSSTVTSGDASSILYLDMFYE